MSRTVIKFKTGPKIRPAAFIPSVLIGVPLSLGDIFEDKGEGRLRLPHDGCIARFDGVTRIFNRLIEKHSGARTMRLYNFSGYERDNPSEPNANRTAALGEQLRRFVMIYRPEWNKHLKTEARVWGTEAQIREAIIQAVKDGADPEDPAVTLVTATNFMHHFRTTQICKYLKPPAWELKVGLVRHQFSFHSIANEIGGTLSALRRMRKNGKIDFKALAQESRN